jgi:NTE family protein
MTTALVLGAGGTVGMAYHAGVLKALADAGIDPGASDLIIGTSAGSVMGALIRSGWTADDLWAASQGSHPILFKDPDQRRQTIRAPAWRTGLGLARRLVGASWVMSRSVLRWPPVHIPAPLGRLYPGGLASGTEMRADLANVLGEGWPAEPLWLCTIDIHSGKRIVLGRRGPSNLPLPDAVRASTAIPGLYPPVRYGRMVLVDGGAHSTTNADLAARVDPSLVIVVAPMCIDPSDAPPPLGRFGRNLPSRSLANEVRQLRAKGIDVLLLRPCAEEIGAHGLDLMRVHGTEMLAAAARASAARILDSDVGQRLTSS